MRPALLALLAFTASLYLVNLSHSGYANEFYSAAVQAGTKSWKAFFFGSSDAANFITVDKPPAFMWVMDLSARIFGLSPWSVLAPEALEGVASVGLLYLCMRRAFSAGTALFAGALLAITPVATLMFRFNNPDALLVMLLLGATYGTLRAVESGRTAWLVLAGTLVGFGFLTKLLQAFIVVPVLGGVYLLVGPRRMTQRLAQLVAAGTALVVAGAWWVVAVQLIPASQRPYVGGSQDDSLFNVIFGYNGLGRLSGSETGAVGFASSASGGSGSASVLRLFDDQFRTQIGWFLPAALLAIGVALWLTSRMGRRDPRRVATLVWGGSLLLTGLVFSLSRGIIHTYYAVALAPAICALAAAACAMLWERRQDPRCCWALAGMALVTITWDIAVLGTPSIERPPGLVPLALLLVVAAAALVVPLRRRWMRLGAAGLALASCLGGPLDYSLATVASAHQTAMPVAGQQKLFGMTLTALAGGSLLVASHPSATLTALLRSDAASYTWVAATVGSERAAGYQLATGDPVMAVGGFNGTDPAPTLATFEHYVAEDRVHYFINAVVSIWPRLADRTVDANRITSWVKRHYRPSYRDGVALYDLARPPA